MYLSSGHLYFGTYNSGDILPNNIATDGNWHLATVSYNGSIWQLYLDSIYQGQYVGAPNTVTGPGMFIGKWGSSPAYQFSGSIDEVLIYNRSLSASEIQTLYYGGRWGGNKINSSQTSRSDSWKLGIKAADSGAISNELNSSALLILDNQKPKFTQIPRNRVNEYKVTNTSIKVNATDNDHIDSYAVNDSRFGINSNGNFRNTSRTPVGRYYINITISDEVNVNSTRLNINVTDTLAPNWSQRFTNKSFEYRVTNYNVDYNATDYRNISRFYTNDSNYINISQSGLAKNITRLPLGIRFLRISVNDTSNNTNSSTIKLNVTDNIAPQWNGTFQNRTIEFHNISYRQVFRATDYHNRSRYYINDTVRFNISQNGTLRNITKTPVSTYHILVSVNDTSNNTNRTQVTIVVQDTTPPYWNQTPTDRNINFHTVFVYNVNATDPSCISKYFINDTVRFSINRTNGNITNASLLTIGTYRLNISVNDTYNRVRSRQISVIVVDAGFPTWIQVPQNQIASYQFLFRYDVNATDDVGIDKYAVNDSIRFNVSSSTGIINNKTVIAIGTYRLNISVNDTSGNKISQTITVTVRDITAPLFTQYPKNKTVEFSVDSLYTDVNATDNVAISKYYVNNTVNFNITQSGQLRNKTLLAYRTHHVRIYVNDTTNNINSTLIVLTMVDTVKPQISYSTLTRANNSYVNRNYTEINVSYTESNFQNLTFNVNGTKVTNLTQIKRHNRTNLNDGNYSCNFSIHHQPFYKRTEHSQRNLYLQWNSKNILHLKHKHNQEEQHQFILQVH